MFALVAHRVLVHHTGDAGLKYQFWDRNFIEIWPYIIQLKQLLQQISVFFTFLGSTNKAHQMIVFVILASFV